MLSLIKKKDGRVNVVVSVVLFLIVMTYLFELLLILPILYGDSYRNWEKVKHIIAGTWILLNVVSSYLIFVHSHPSVDFRMMPSVSPAEWQYCDKCQSNCPPRSYHCSQCGYCVLVRDHHCVIGSICVGYKNRRYFVLLNFYMWLALFYANVLNMNLMWDLYYAMQYKSLLTMTFPLVAWILGYADGKTILLALFTSFCVVTFLYATAVLLFHMKNTVRGRTTHEMKKNLGFKYDLGVLKNIEQTFGLNWKIGWLCPLIQSPLPGDGVVFPEKDSLKHSGKDL